MNPCHRSHYAKAPCCHSGTVAHHNNYVQGAIIWHQIFWNPATRIFCRQDRWQSPAVSGKIQRTATTELFKDASFSLNSAFHIALVNEMLPGLSQETEAGMGSLVLHNKPMLTCPPPWASHSMSPCSVKKVLALPSFKEGIRVLGWAPGVLASTLNLESWECEPRLTNSPFSRLIFCISPRPITL